MDLLRQIASRLGSKPPEPLRSAMTLDVIGPAPAASVPFPSNIDEIMLGTRQLRPTGTATYPNRPTVKVGPPLNNLTEEAMQFFVGPDYKRGAEPTEKENKLLGAYLKVFLDAYPDAGKMAQSVFIDPPLENISAAGKHYDGGIGLSRRILRNPLLVLQTLAHEFTHGAQHDATEGNYEPWRTMTGPRTITSMLNEPIGEQQAYALDEEVLKKLLDPNFNWRR